MSSPKRRASCGMRLSRKGEPDLALLLGAIRTTALRLPVRGLRMKTEDLGPRSLPRTVAQTFPHGDLPERLAENRRHLQRLNPGWTFELFDDTAIVDYIRAHFGGDVLAAYLSIAPHYGAARADFFRYLRVYAGGGVYLDIKSTVDRPLDDIVAADEQFILCQWANAPGEPRQGFGLHADLRGVPGGEYQQWHVIARPGHPLLAAVIERVLANIRTYNPWRFSVGKPGVLRTTGPIAYTLAIAPLLDRYPHRLTRDETSLGLRFSIKDGYDHRTTFSRHYSTLTAPLVPARGVGRVSDAVYDAAYRVRNVIRSGR